MSDLRVQYDEELVGAGHSTKSDTLNQLLLASGARDSDGKSNYLVFKKQASAPSTDADEMALYVKEDEGQLKLYLRDQSGGGETALTS